MIEVFHRGGPVMVPLLICSIVGLTVILERAFFWLRETLKRDQVMVERILALAEKGDYEEIQKQVTRHRDYVVRVLISGLVHREFSLASAMEVATQEELRRMKRYLPILDTLITLCPMLGILGTVTGIIQSFDLLGSSGIQDPRTVTVGIAQALITTAVGLAIALSCLIPYNYYLRKAEKATDEMETYGTSLEIVYTKNRLPYARGSGSENMMEDSTSHEDSKGRTAKRENRDHTAY
jgi:biopolymer transport protein ExbB